MINTTQKINTIELIQHFFPKENQLMKLCKGLKTLKTFLC